MDRLGVSRQKKQGNMVCLPKMRTWENFVAARNIDTIVLFLFPHVWLVESSEAEEAPSFLFSPCGRVDSSGSLGQTALTSRHHCLQKKKQSNRRGRDCCGRGWTLYMCWLWLSVSPSCSFGPRQGFLWLVLNTESIPFPCKDDFSSKFSVCTAAKMLP